MHIYRAATVRERVLTTLLTALLLTGCTKLQQPEVSPPKVMRSGAKVVLSQKDLSQMKWWERMHDPILTRLIREALIKNNQIQVAQANILQAQAQLQAARYAWLPTLDVKGYGFTGGGSGTKIVPHGSLARSGLLSNVNNIHFDGYYAGFVPQYSLNFLANISNERYAIAAVETQKAMALATRLSIISQVSGAYFMLLGQREQHQILAIQVRDLKKLRALEFSRFQAGLSDISTVTDDDRQIAMAQANLLAAENSEAQLENALHVLIDSNPGPMVTKAHIQHVSVKGMIPANVPSAVLQNRPDILQSQYQLKMSLANVGISYSQFFPNFSLTTVFGAASLNLKDLLNFSTGLWVAQGIAGMPLLNGATYEQIIASKAGYQSSLYAYVETLREAFADVDNSLTNQQKMNQAYVSQAKALHDAERLYQLMLQRYHIGYKDYRDVLNAKLNVDTEMQNVNLAKMQQLDALVQVYQALAAGVGSNRLPN